MAPEIRKTLCGNSRCVQESVESNYEGTSVMEIRRGIETVSAIYGIANCSVPKEERIQSKASDWDLFMSPGCDNHPRNLGYIMYYICGKCGGIITTEDGVIVRDQDTIALMLLGEKLPGTPINESDYLKTQWY